MFRILASLTIAAMLAACASTPAYSPATRSGGSGYSETQIESNRYFVTYRSASATDAALLQDYALLRAADLTLQSGRDWFWVDRRTLDDPAGRSGPSVGIGVGGARGGGRSAVGASVGFSIPLGGGGERARSATLEVRFGSGPKPDDPNAYDARAVSQNIRSRMPQ